MQLPDLAGRAELTRRYAHLLGHFAAELGQRPLVLQNGRFFPDPYERDEPSVARLLCRLQAHAGMGDIPTQVRVLALEPGLGGGACSSGACAPVQVSETPATARIEELGDGWLVNVFDAELQHPVGLTTQLARALGRIFLAESASAETPVEAPVDITSELAAVALGFGPLLLEGSYIYAKSCGGPSVTQLTKLSVGELAVACSLFIAVGAHSGRSALGYLSTTQRALLSEANDWAASNARVIDQLRTNPGQLATRAPELRDARPWLLRLFDRPRRSEASLEQALSGGLGDAELLELARSLDPRKAGESTSARAERQAAGPASKDRDELRALVDDALSSS